MKGLPPIPEIEIGQAGAIALAAANPEGLADLLRAGRKLYTALGQSWADKMARNWLEKTGNPYLAELEQVAKTSPLGGVFALNMGYEMACTSAALPCREGGSRLVRVLDWKLPGLGRHLMLARQQGPAGAFYNLTWPGYAGVVTGMAKGRFAAAINQPPASPHGLGRWGDWLVNRMQVWQGGGIPPAHLLRQVFETAPDYDTARRMLIETRLAMPAFFILAGPGACEGCVIERTTHNAAVRPAPAVAANHWISMSQKGRPRGKDSHGRQAALERLSKTPPSHFNWLAPPVLNKDTRVVALADPASGFLRAQGWEKGQPATRPLFLEK